MAAALRYTAYRVVLLFLTLGVLYALGARGLVLLVLAVLLSGILSFVVLSRQRDEMSAALTGSYGRMRENLDARAASEDRD